jgi:ADP-ribose pyrophosphatase YjhB (NUDIX family)
MSLIKDKEDEALVNHLLLPYEDGSHGAAKIILSGDADSSEYETLSIASFKHRLESTITACKELDKKSLWLEVPISKARYIEACSDIEGLEFHHASGNTAYLSMWLRDDIECKIPEFATHQIGVGAIVVNSRDEILCVRELRRNFRPWKIPGGLADLGEQLNDAAIREVMEETGWQISKPKRLGAFRRFVFMPEYDLWAEKICHIYVAKPTRQICDPLEVSHFTTVMEPSEAAFALGNDGDRSFVEHFFGLQN